jgi:hypothetical protein
MCLAILRIVSVEMEYLPFEVVKDAVDEAALLAAVSLACFLSLPFSRFEGCC